MHLRPLFFEGYDAGSKKHRFRRSARLTVHTEAHPDALRALYRLPAFRDLWYFLSRFLSQMSAREIFS
jgi:hypothetical protein